MKKTFYYISLIAFIITAAYPLAAQKHALHYPQGYFRNPLDIPIQLAANFGEIRSNHFHMGLDIRTNSKENLPVYAAASGYISRIKIEKYGFGRAIYITHPNGYTTLYAHLNNFFPALQAFLENKQYADKSWEQDFLLQPDEFPINKNSFIAYSGNTGASQGPHLHFEIRDTETGANYNPELFGFEIPDAIAPVIASVYLYNRQYSTYSVPPQLIKKTDTVTTGFSTVSIGISAEDKNNTSSFKYGIYGAQLWVDDELINAFTLDNISYDESRDINGAIDYSRFVQSRAGIQYLFRLPGNEIPIYSDDAGEGLIDLSDSLPHTIEIFVRDVSGNISSRSFVLQYSAALQKNYAMPANTTLCVPSKKNIVQTANATAIFSEHAFYDTVRFIMAEQAPAAANQPSSIIQLHNNAVPVHDAYALSIRTTLPQNDARRNKMVMQLTSGGNHYTKKGSWQGDWMTASFKNLGTAKLLIDTIAPVIAPLNWKNGKVFSSGQSLVFRCADNLEELDNCTALLDGNWLLFSKKYDYFTYKMDEHCTPGAHQLVITATDLVGNTTVKTFSFIKK